MSTLNAMHDGQTKAQHQIKQQQSKHLQHNSYYLQQQQRAEQLTSKVFAPAEHQQQQQQQEGINNSEFYYPQRKLQHDELYPVQSEQIDVSINNNDDDEDVHTVVHARAAVPLPEVQPAQLQQPQQCGTMPARQRHVRVDQQQLATLGHGSAHLAAYKLFMSDPSYDIVQHSFQTIPTHFSNGKHQNNRNLLKYINTARANACHALGLPFRRVNDLAALYREGGNLDCGSLSGVTRISYPPHDMMAAMTFGDFTFSFVNHDGTTSASFPLFPPVLKNSNNNVQASSYQRTGQEVKLFVSQINGHCSLEQLRFMFIVLAGVVPVDIDMKAPQWKDNQPVALGTAYVTVRDRIEANHCIAAINKRVMIDINCLRYAETPEGQHAMLALEDVHELSNQNRFQQLPFKAVCVSEYQKNHGGGGRGAGVAQS